jgi:VIT1/CCC1 family predicted Fe2+/Mn2+ transporter
VLFELGALVTLLPFVVLRASLRMAGSIVLAAHALFILCVST